MLQRDEWASKLVLRHRPKQFWVNHQLLNDVLHSCEYRRMQDDLCAKWSLLIELDAEISDFRQESLVIVIGEKLILRITYIFNTINSFTPAIFSIFLTLQGGTENNLIREIDKQGEHTLLPSRR